MDVKTLATQLDAAFDHRTRDNGDAFVCLKDDSPEWMTTIIRTAHGDKLPNDTVYAIIECCADAIASYGVEGKYAAQDAITEIEPNAYTHELTGWLNARVDHVYYLTQALQECEPKDGFQALAIAQQLQIREIGDALVSALTTLADEWTEAEDAVTNANETLADAQDDTSALSAADIKQLRVNVATAKKVLAELSK